MNINNQDLNLLYEAIKNTIFTKFDNEKEDYLNKENIYYKQNKEKLIEEIIKYKNYFIKLINERYKYKLEYRDEDIIMLDILIKNPLESDLIKDEIKEEKIIKWINILGSYFLYYIKKNTRMNYKIKYPIYSSYFEINDERIYPFLIAAKKISIDEVFENYNYFGELIALMLNEDFKPDIQYEEEIRDKNKKVILKSYIKNRG